MNVYLVIGKTYLEHFVICSLSSSTVDVGGSRRLLKCSSILAHIGPPDIVQCARSAAVDTFAIVGSNDDVGQDSTIFKNENCVRFTSLGLALASAG